MRNLFILLLILFLSACGPKSTANQIIDELEAKNYFQAKTLYEKESEDEDSYADLKDAVSEELQNYIDKKYIEVEDDPNNRPGFYFLLTSIEEMDVHDYALEDTIDYYKDLLEDDTSSVSISTYDEQDEEDSEYESEEVIYEASTEEDEYVEETSNHEDHDCSDFPTHYDAQLFYEANGGPESDPHDLDRDNDGLACDWNP